MSSEPSRVVDLRNCRVCARVIYFYNRTRGLESRRVYRPTLCPDCTAVYYYRKVRTH